jgi:Cu+-exporting ATPase
MTTTTIDPVCGMPVQHTDQVATYAGQTYQFCSTVCRDRFEADPQNFIPTTAPAGA